jgi:hypothetical protein
VEPSVVEQADAGAIVVCGGAGAAGADGAGECIARTYNDSAWAQRKRAGCELPFSARDACGVSFEDEYGAQRWKHEPLKTPRGTSVMKKRS